MIYKLVPLMYIEIQISNELLFEHKNLRWIQVNSDDLWL